MLFDTTVNTALRVETIYVSNGHLYTALRMPSGRIVHVPASTVTNTVLIADVLSRDHAREALHDVNRARLLPSPWSRYYHRFQALVRGPIDLHAEQVSELQHNFMELVHKTGRLPQLPSEHVTECFALSDDVAPLAQLRDQVNQILQPTAQQPSLDPRFVMRTHLSEDDNTLKAYFVSPAAMRQPTPGTSSGTDSEKDRFFDPDHHVFRRGDFSPYSSDEIKSEYCD